MSELPPAGWYPDPQDANRQRYWDGKGWTEHTADTSPQVAASGGAGAGSTTTSSGPDTWTWQSIVATIFCCNILGVIGVLNAGRAEQALKAGDAVAASEHAASARKWTLWSAGVSLGLIALYILFVVVVAGSIGIEELNQF